MPAPVASSPLDYGILGGVLILLYLVVDFLKAVILKRKGAQNDYAPRLVCQQDPIHHERIKEIHAMTVDTEKRKDDGDYNCHWKNRDEVMRFIIAQENQTTATEKVITALNALTAELRLTRNGKSTR